jgi:ATP-binding cassette subfamily B protein
VSTQSSSARHLTTFSPLVGAALALVWGASRTRTLLSFVVQLVGSLLLLAQVLLIKQVLDVALAAGQGSAVSEAVLPVVLLAVVSAVGTVLATVGELQLRVLGELVTREVWRQVLAVSRRVSLRTYEDPAFYDQAQRVQVSAAEQTQIVVQALTVLIGGVLGALAGTVAVLRLAPLLLPVLLLSGVPLYLTSRLSGRYEFRFATTQSAPRRERTYLQTVLTVRRPRRYVRSACRAPSTGVGRGSTGATWTTFAPTSAAGCALRWPATPSRPSSRQRHCCSCSSSSTGVGSTSRQQAPCSSPCGSSAPG